MWIYVAILLLIFSLFLRNMENFEEKKKGILVLYGESFRTGDVRSRDRDCDECLETQKQASRSHTDFIKFVQEKYNVTLDVIIDTYDTKYQKELKSFYTSPEFYSHPELLGWDKICQDAVNRIDKTKYDFIFFTRVDIFIKPEFYKVFDPFWSNIKFISPVEQESFPCGFKKNKNGVYFPQINPIFMFFPEKYFYTLENINAGHEAWSHYMDTYHLTEDDMGFMVDYQFNANSSITQNPYYKMIGRPESSDLMDKNAIIQYPLIKSNLPTC